MLVSCGLLACMMAFGRPEAMATASVTNVPTRASEALKSTEGVQEAAEEEASACVRPSKQKYGTLHPV